MGNSEFLMPIWLLPSATFIVGLIIGLIIAKARQSTPAQTQQQLDDLQLRFSQYQEDVATHINTTASLMNTLNQNYQDVQEHLAMGAERLTLDEVARQKLLARLQDNEPKKERIGTSTLTASAQPPKDYAPKGEQDIGALDESYGLKTKASD
ncbi:YhcB family protein [Thiopseudomonas alkaliphila]